MIWLPAEGGQTSWWLVIMAVLFCEVSCDGEAVWQQTLKAILLNWLICLSLRKMYGEGGEERRWLWLQLLLRIPVCAFGLVWEDNSYASNVKCASSFFERKIQILWKLVLSFKFMWTPRSSVQTYQKARNILRGKSCRRRETLRTTAVSETNYAPSSHASSPWSTWCQSPVVLSDEQWQSEEWDVFLRQQNNQTPCIKTNTDTLPKTGQAKQWGASYRANATWRRDEAGR